MSGRSPPTRGRGLKRFPHPFPEHAQLSPPTRGRGLKRVDDAGNPVIAQVAPYAGARIETSWSSASMRLGWVAPYAGARVHCVQQVTDARKRAGQVLSTARSAEPTSERISSISTPARLSAPRLEARFEAWVPRSPNHDGADMAQSAREPRLTGDNQARRERTVWDLTAEHWQTDSAERCAACMHSGGSRYLDARQCMGAGDYRPPGVDRPRRAEGSCTCVSARERAQRMRVRNRTGRNGNEGPPFPAKRQRAIA